MNVGVVPQIVDGVPAVREEAEVLLWILVEPIPCKVGDALHLVAAHNDRWKRRAGNVFLPVTTKIGGEDGAA